MLGASGDECSASIAQLLASVQTVINRARTQPNDRQHRVHSLTVPRHPFPDGAHSHTPIGERRSSHIRCARRDRSIRTLSRMIKCENRQFFFPLIRVCFCLAPWVIFANGIALRAARMSAARARAHQRARHQHSGRLIARKCRSHAHTVSAARFNDCECLCGVHFVCERNDKPIRNDDRQLEVDLWPFFP